MSNQPTWTRRTFVSTLSLAGAAIVAAPRLDASPRNTSHHFAFISLPDRLETWRVEGDSWTIAHSTPCESSPQALALHPTQSVLYACHNVDRHADLPRGSVSAFSIDRTTGALTPLSHEPMSLSATHPEHLAVSPDGSSLLVSSTTGGAYNLFALAPDGALLPVPYALKQIGSEASSASPRAAVFSKDGSAAYAADLGADRISHIAIENRIPSIGSRVSLEPGSGPAHLALHPSGRLLIVASTLRPGLTVIPIDTASGQLLTPTQTIALPGETAGPIALSPSGNLVYATTADATGHTSVTVSRLDRSTGRLTSLRTIAAPGATLPTQLHVNGDTLHLVSTSGVSTLRIAAGTGLSSASLTRSGTPNAHGLATLAV